MLRIAAILTIIGAVILLTSTFVTLATFAAGYGVRALFKPTQ